MILDNLNVHKSPRAAKALAERGAWFLFLPKYSPDLNPIEMAFAKLKALLQKGQGAKLRRPMARRRGHLRPLHTPGMLELSQENRIRCRLNARDSRSGRGASRRAPLLPGGPQSPMRWVIISEIWYKAGTP